MSLISVLQQFNGDYTSLFAKGKCLVGSDLGWTLTQMAVTRKNKEFFCKNLQQHLVREDLSQIPNAEGLIRRINRVFASVHTARADWALEDNSKIIQFKSTHPTTGWLSNFYPTWVLYKDTAYPSPEHLYQITVCQKLDSKHCDANGMLQLSPGRVKEVGKKIQELWAKGVSEKVLEQCTTAKVEFMRRITALKYKYNDSLKESLLETVDCDLQEATNSSFWGIGSDGKGQNHLGNILKDHREQLLAENNDGRG